MTDSKDGGWFPDSFSGSKTKPVGGWISTPLKNISQNGNLRQIGVKINNVWNHHPENDHILVGSWCLKMLRIKIAPTKKTFLVWDLFKTPSRNFQTTTTDFGAIFFVVWVVVSKKIIHFKVEIQRTPTVPPSTFEANTATVASASTLGRWLKGSWKKSKTWHPYKVGPCYL